jgi:mannan endo-1,4-beta-mannosidase
LRPFVLVATAALVALAVSGLMACDSGPARPGASANRGSAKPAPARTVHPPPDGPASGSQLFPIKKGEFVVRQRSKLRLGSSEFRFIGANAYYLQPEIAYGNVAGVEKTLNDMAAIGLSVVRTIGFNDHPPEKDRAAIQIRPGVYNEQNLLALDFAIAEARARNIRVILYLTGNWDAFGGIDRYVQWYREQCGCEATHDDFYTNGTIRQWYKGYVAMLLGRTNSVTGVAYESEPGILAYELANEPRSGAGKSAIVLEWLAEMSEYIKSIDHNHLVADGGEGFDDEPKLYPGLSKRYPVGGSTGNSYHRLVAIPDVDLASYHMFPVKYDLNDAGDANTWIAAHEKIASAAGKVAYLGEFGAAGTASQRARIFKRWLEQGAANHNSGSILWQLGYDGRPDSDGFTIYSAKDEDVMSTLSQYAKRTLPTPTRGSMERLSP